MNSAALVTSSELVFGMCFERALINLPFFSYFCPHSSIVDFEESKSHGVCILTDTLSSCIVGAVRRHTMGTSCSAGAVTKAHHDFATDDSFNGTCWLEMTSLLGKIIHDYVTTISIVA